MRHYYVGQGPGQELWLSVLRAQLEDGQNGQHGQDGQNGQDGQHVRILRWSEWSLNALVLQQQALRQA